MSNQIDFNTNGVGKLTLTSTGNAHIATDIAELKITVRSEKESLELAKESVNKRSQYIQGTVKAKDLENNLNLTTTYESSHDNLNYYYSEVITIYGKATKLILQLLNNFSDKLQDTIHIHPVSYTLSEQSINHCRLLAYKNATDLLNSKIQYTLSLIHASHAEILSLTELDTSEAYGAKSKLLYTHNLIPENDEMVFLCISKLHAVINLPAKSHFTSIINEK